MPRFYPPEASAPLELRTGDAILRPLSARHNSLDYDAVMASQQRLRVSSTNGWPREGFTLEENLADLIEHEREFMEGRAFVYTVLTPEESRCLGCVYIYPRERVLRSRGAGAEASALVGDDEAEVRFWVRTERLADDMDRRLLAALRAWLREAFAFASVRYGVLAREERQVALLRAAGLRLLARYPVDGTEYLSFG